MAESRDELDELKDFFSAPDDESNDPYSLGVAGLSAVPNPPSSGASKPPIEPLDKPETGSGNRRFRGPGASLFDEEDPLAVENEATASDEAAGSVGELAWSEM